MNITELLAEFLQQGKSVTLPGLFTLKCEEREAYHDKQKGVFYPAGRAIVCAEPDGQADDIKAAIAERECVNADVAEQMWRNYIDALSDKLQRVGSHEITGVGTINYSGERASFITSDDFAGVAANTHEQPIEDIKQYAPAPNEEDPFAIFDQPQMPQPEEPEPQPTETEPQPNQPAEPEPMPEVVEDALRQLEEMPKSKAEIKAEERAAKERAKAEARAEKERRKTEQAAAKAAKQAAKDQEKAAKLAAKDQAKAAKQAAMDQAKEAKEASKPKPEPKPQPEPKPEKPRREKKQKQNDDGKKKRFPWLLILLLLLLLCGGGYAIYKYVYLPNATNADGSSRPINHIDAPRTNAFTYNTDMIEYSQRDVVANRDKVCRFLAPYISEYLASRHYTSARAAMMDRVNQYAQVRLDELLGDQMAVQRFLPYTDYIYEYNHDFLKYIRAGRSRVTVQTELMNLSLLDQMLNQLVTELGLEPDGAGFDAKQVAAVKKSEEPKPVATAHFETASKQGFDIIAGFNVNRDRAVQLASRLKSLGCDAYIIDKNGLYYVSMGSAPTRTAAEALFKHIKSWYDGDAAIKEW